MTDDKFDSDINFSKVLFLHINRIGMATTQDAMDSQVEMLESMLFPYIDDAYDGDVKKATVESAAFLTDRKRAELTKIKFRALMSLAERKGLLLEKTDRDEVWELEEENADVEDTQKVAE